MGILNIIRCLTLIYFFFSIEVYSAAANPDEDDRALNKIVESANEECVIVSQLQDDVSSTLSKIEIELKTEEGVKQPREEIDGECKSQEIVVVRRKIRNMLKETCNKTSSDHDNVREDIDVKELNKDVELSDKTKSKIKEKFELKIKKNCGKWESFNLKTNVDFIMKHLETILENSISLNYVHIIKDINPHVSELFEEANKYVTEFFEDAKYYLEDLKDVMYPTLRNRLDIKHFDKLIYQYEIVHTLLLQDGPNEFNETKMEKVLSKNPFEAKEALVLPDDNLFSTLKDSFQDYENEFITLLNDLTIIESSYSNMDNVLHKSLHNLLPHIQNTEEKIIVLKSIRENFNKLINEAEIANETETFLDNSHLIFDTYQKLMNEIGEMKKEICKTTENIAKLLVFEDSLNSETIAKLIEELLNVLLCKNIKARNNFVCIPKTTKQLTIQDLSTALSMEHNTIYDICHKCNRSYLEIFPTHGPTANIISLNPTYKIKKDLLSKLPTHFSHLVSLKYSLMQFNYLKDLLDGFIGVPFGEIIEEMLKSGTLDPLSLGLKIQVNQSAVEFLKFNFWFLEGRMNCLIHLEEKQYEFTKLNSKIKKLDSWFKESALYLNAANSKYNILMEKKNEMDQEEMQLNIKYILRYLTFFYKSLTNFNKYDYISNDESL